MSFLFVQPKQNRDTIVAAREALFLVMQGLRLTEPSTGSADIFRVVPRAYSHFGKMIEAMKLTDEAKPENLAWQWLGLTVLEATAQFLVHLRRDTILLAAKKEEAVEGFLHSAMTIPSECEFNHSVLSDLSAHPVVQPAIEALPELILSVTSLTNCDMAAYKLKFKDCLRRHSTINATFS